MTAARQNAREVFLAALEISEGAERAAFLDKSCGSDDALRRRVEDLLRAYGQSDGPLDKLAAALAPTQLGETIREQVGTTIGPYKLMEQIGEGGFGLVFVAEQQQPLRRKVALKIIKPGMDTRDVIARFKAEQQALALMDHPNIARVLDAGTTESGRPYFVMELVRGIPITDYCDRSQLTPRERLELFIPVCNAIQHAHLKGIIHRDIKPSNVLVTLHDGKPVVKVIDFGVAKALHQSLTDRTIYTRFAQMIGTPLYMSPEQAEMSGLDIDTRTDVYSLGVLLYELLTGTTPFDKQRLARAAYDELLRIIREEEPPKPSVRLSRSTDSLPSIAAQRKTEPAKLSKMFYGDLDWIAMKSLEKDRTRRYETANAFAADVSRYLNDEPVEACPPSTAYRLRKFVRKHRKPVITLAAIAAALIVGIAGMTWGLVRARRAEKTARIAETAAVGSEGKALLALEQVAKERDAKEVERDRAERQLADGLLRSIGFQQSEQNPVDSRTWADWSAIKDSRLKLRVLEVAFEKPEVAIRVARRAPCVIQACVGLSPTRRARALELLLARQRDEVADPRIRIAACWLASGLGSQDIRPGADAFLAALKTSNTEKSRSFLIDAFTFLAGQLDRAQVTRACDALIESFGRSGDLVGAAELAKLAERLNDVELARVCDILVTALRSYDLGLFYDRRAFNDLMLAIAPRLRPDQIHRIGDALVEKLHRETQGVGNIQIDEWLPWLQTTDISRAGAAMIARFEKSKKVSIRLDALEVLRKLSVRLEPVLAKQCVQILEAFLAEPVKKNDEDERRLRMAVLETLISLSPRMEPAQVARLWDTLMVVLTESGDSDSIFTEKGPSDEVMSQLAAHLDSARVKRSADLIIGKLGTTSYAFDSVLRAVAPRFQADQAARAWDAYNDRHGDTQPILTAMAMRLEPAKVDRIVETLANDLMNSRWGHQPAGWNLNDTRFVALRRARRVQPSHERRLATALIAMLEKRQVRDVIMTMSVVRGLAPRLQAAEAKRIGDALLAADQTLHQTIGTFQLQLQIEGELAELASQLEPSQVSRCADLIRARLDSGTVVGTCGRVLRKLKPRLGTALCDQLSTKAATILLDCWMFSREFGTGSMDRSIELTEPSPPAYEIVASLSSPRSVAKLLSHPSCVAEMQELFLERFEELLFYEGKTVLLTCEDVGLEPDIPEGTQQVDEPPPRRFRTMHDVTEWIKQNWPDFDLEATCPATWRDSN